jgi:membrane protein required for colicin V production
MDALPIHVYDIILLAVLAAATVFGFWKGMAWQLASLGSIVVSGIVAVQFGNRVAPMISDNEPWNRFLAMLILYLATSLAIWLLFRVVSGAIDQVHLKEFDRQVGAMFGFAKGVLLCLVITFFAVTLSENARQSVLRSRSGYYIAVGIERAAPAMPREVQGYLSQLSRKLDPKAPPSPRIDFGASPTDATAGGSLRDQLEGAVRQRVDDELDRAFQNLPEVDLSPQQREALGVPSDQPLIPNNWTGRAEQGSPTWDWQRGLPAATQAVEDLFPVRSGSVDSSTSEPIR